MKRTIISAFLILLVGQTLLSQVGCMDNSHHLKQKYDSKNYHYVACQCTCDTHAAYGKKTPNRNKCIECGHFHDPRPEYAAGHHPDRIQRTTPILSPQAFITGLIQKTSKPS